MLFLYLAAVMVGQPPADSSSLAQEQLRRRVALAIRDNPEIVEPAQFGIDQVALYYRFGGLKEFINSPLLLEEIPVATQFTVEAIRHTIHQTWGPLSRKIFSDYLVQVEEIIEKELSLLANGKGQRAEVASKLAEYKQSTDAILLSAIHHFGKKEGRYVAPCGATLIYDNQCRVAYYTTAAMEPVQKGFKVAIKSNPEGASISYMSSGRYIAASMTGRLTEDLWTPVLTEHRILNGVYYFRAKWYDIKKERSPTKTIIDHDDAVLVIRPDPPKTPPPARHEPSFQETSRLDTHLDTRPAHRRHR